MDWKNKKTISIIIGIMLMVIVAIATSWWLIKVKKEKQINDAEPEYVMTDEEKLQEQYFKLESMRVETKKEIIDPPTPEQEIAEMKRLSNVKVYVDSEGDAKTPQQQMMELKALRNNK